MSKRLTRVKGGILMSKFNSSLGIERILAIISKEKINVHFIGVGGVGMSGLFCLTKYFGISASGSDRANSPMLEALKATGADVFIGSRERLPENTALAVYSLAIADDDPEILLCESLGIETVSRAEYLAAVEASYDMSISVSGSHGKSTVTAMLEKIFSYGEKSPTVLSGAELGVGDVNFRIGTFDYFIYESCEYKDSFLKTSPSLALFLNMELDHVDYFKSEEALASSFLRAVERAGAAIVNTDDTGLLKIASMARGNIISVGSRGGEDYTFSKISVAPRNLCFGLQRGDKYLGEIFLPMLGEFNISNGALAAVAALESGIPFSSVAAALSDFGGIGRRLECIGELRGAPVYYDYAHHPTEIQKSISAVRAAYEGKITVIFSPHTYSRTERLFSDFVEALTMADRVLITEIYAARERDGGTVSSEMLADAVGGEVLRDTEQLLGLIEEDEGAYLIMGAGDTVWIKKIFEKWVDKEPPR